MPRRTTKRRTKTNLKTKNENGQKIELYRSLITKELKKKHSSRPVGVAEIGSQERGLVAGWWLEDWGEQGGGWQTRQSHICVQINQEEQLRSKTDHAT